MDAKSLLRDAEKVPRRADEVPFLNKECNFEIYFHPRTSAEIIF
jgi:hypothetical protein